MRKLKAGKLDTELLERIVFKHVKHRREEVLVRPGVGEDCATLDFGPYECVMSTDPITAAISEIGRLAVHITCNDIASNGVEPLGIMLAVMLPVGTTDEEIEDIMKQAAEVAESLEVEIIGGHTEITPAVNRPVIVSTAIGRTVSGGSQRAKAMRPGDCILMTKYAGLEGTGIIASDFERRLKEVITEEEQLEAKAFLKQVSVVKEGIAAGKVGTAGMHDITEGGVLGAVWELCEISKTGVELNLKAIPVKEVTKKICNHFDIDYLRLISSGCMMIVAHPEKKAAVIKAVEETGVPIACIGVVKEREEGRILVQEDGTKIDIVPPASDELYKIVK
ncbi:AIR synthase family protein [Sinanaerobacter sp. ZZT-01]|uniref:AIR synthase family protein n=1 Tax=Sinanaerobacter sp. ZZT-01 TaxID=3111540 RepID=UPI002D79A2FA|nr:AIR synthase family protein [Sinanaerobacter sp. ZZT-01]WRR94109.1 AIR synthase family protein [Sinanaerobacter sp. ZZT-01]